MVTIGPLIVLGVLGVTFHIGAKPVSPVATNQATILQAQSISQPRTNVHQMSESVGTDLALQRETQSDISSSQDFGQAIEPPNVAPALQKNRSPGGSVDTSTMSRSERPSTRGVFSAGQHQPAGGERVSLNDTAINPQESASGPICSVAGSSASHVPDSLPLGKTQPSRGNVFDQGAGNEADPEKVNKCCYSDGRVGLTSLLYILSHVR